MNQHQEPTLPQTEATTQQSEPNCVMPGYTDLNCVGVGDCILFGCYRSAQGQSPPA